MSDRAQGVSGQTVDGRRGILPVVLVCTALLLPVSADAAASLTLRLAPEQVKQGGVTILTVESPVSLHRLRIQVGDRNIHPPAPNGDTRVNLWIGVDLEQTPGSLPVRVEAVDESGHSLAGQGSLWVVDARFPVQRLTVPRPFVHLDSVTLERVNREKAIMDGLWQVATPAQLWGIPFRIPLDGAGPAFGFGVRRIINGEPRAPHTGVDFAAAQGTPVLAANAGAVALVADQFFSGTSVVLDHGLGLYTMYFHLQDSLVQTGQRVEPGQIIAHVGSTGRATGPHLHWGARLDQARIDPRDLLQPWPSK